MKNAMLNYLVDHNRGCFIKAIDCNGNKKDLTIDSSLALIFILGVIKFQDPVLQKTLDIVEEKLGISNKNGGIARHENDNFQRVDKKFTGNPWIISTLWIARWKIAQARVIEDLKNGLNLLNWVCNHSLPSGVLAEQINPIDGLPISVSPLIWSHAEYILSIHEFLNKYQSLVPKTR